MILGFTGLVLSGHRSSLASTGLSLGLTALNLSSGGFRMSDTGLVLELVSGCYPPVSFWLAVMEF